jgi:hypothetical protein
MGTQHQRKGTVGKINTNRKRSSYIEKGLKNHRNTAAQVTAELNIYLEDPDSTNTLRCKLHISTIHGRAAVATESSAQISKRWCHDHETWTSDT